MGFLGLPFVCCATSWWYFLGLLGLLKNIKKIESSNYLLMIEIRSIWIPDSNDIIMTSGSKFENHNPPNSNSNSQQTSVQLIKKKIEKLN